MRNLTSMLQNSTISSRRVQRWGKVKQWQETTPLPQNIWNEVPFKVTNVVQHLLLKYIKKQNGEFDYLQLEIQNWAVPQMWAPINRDRNKQWNTFTNLIPFFSFEIRVSIIVVFFILFFNLFVIYNVFRCNLK